MWNDFRRKNNKVPRYVLKNALFSHNPTLAASELPSGSSGGNPFSQFANSMLLRPYGGPRIRINTC